MSAPDGRRPRWWLSAVVGTLLLFVGLALHQARSTSETYDEPMYILSGYSYLVTGDFSFNREHPPLAKLLLALPLLGLDLVLPESYQVLPGIEYSFYAHQPRADVRQILWRARLPGIALGVVLGLYVLAWARRLFGDGAGLAALLLCLLNPVVLALSTVAGNDFALGVYCTATLYHASRWLGEGSRRHLLFMALMLGCALGTKLTALLLLPALGLIVLGCALARRRVAPIGEALVALLAAVGVLWLIYGGEARSLSDARGHVRFVPKGAEAAAFHEPAIERALEALFGAERPVPLLSYLRGIDHQLEHAAAGHQNYWRGQLSESGAPEFFVVSALFKNPEGLVLLALLALCVWRRTWRGTAQEALLLAFPALLIFVLSRGNAQLGFKYALPVVPLLCVGAARVFAPELRARRGAGPALVLGAGGTTLALGLGGGVPWDADRVLVLLLPWLVAALVWRRSLLHAGLSLVACAAVFVLVHQPHNLMYFNHWVGGPELGWRWSIIGDDWGQDTAALGRWMAEREVPSITYDYYGEGDPEAWGVRGAPLHGSATVGELPVGLLAVPLAFQLRQPERYAFLQGKEPVALVGRTIRIYEITEADRLAARRP